MSEHISKLLLILNQSPPNHVFRSNMELIAYFLKVTYMHKESQLVQSTKQYFKNTNNSL